MFSRCEFGLKIVVHAVSPKPAKMILVQRDEMVEQVATHAAHPAPRHSVLPGTSNTRTHCLESTGVAFMDYYYRSRTHLSLQKARRTSDQSSHRVRARLWRFRRRWTASSIRRAALEPFGCDSVVLTLDGSNVLIYRAVLVNRDDRSESVVWS